MVQGLSFLFSTTVTPATSYAGEATAIPPLGVLPGLLAKRQQLLAVVVDGGADAQQFADDWLADALSLYPGLNGSTFGDGAGFGPSTSPRWQASSSASTAPGSCMTT